ncbi:MAG TPA: gliding motility protein [Polyangiaceae bacterium]|nr:gliding motility protein [Polyangiaceae bacterium]
MPVVNPLARELVFKIVYYGPGLGGKTTTLQHIHATAKPEHRGKMVSLATPVDRTLYFDYLPIRLPTLRGLGIRLQLFTVPGQVYYNATRKLVLTGADGIVLVVDSQRLRADASSESLDNLRDNLREHGRSLGDVPHAIQYNKRDLSDVVPIEELERKLNAHGAPSFATVATHGDGVYEALEAIARAVLDDFEKRVPEGRGLPLQQLELPEGGLTEALRRAEEDYGADSNRAPISTGMKRTESFSMLRLSGLPDADPGEDAARAVTAPLKPVTPEPEPEPEIPHAPLPVREPEIVHAHAQVHEHEQAKAVPAVTALAGGMSFDALWPSAERALVKSLEAALAAHQYGRALSATEQLVARVLASAGSVLGSTSDAPRDPAVVALLLGAEGRRYLEFRALVRDTRGGREVSELEALAAYAFAIELRLMRMRIRS